MKKATETMTMAMIAVLETATTTEGKDTTKVVALVKDMAKMLERVNRIEQGIQPPRAEKVGYIKLDDADETTAVEDKPTDGDDETTMVEDKPTDDAVKNEAVEVTDATNVPDAVAPINTDTPVTAEALEQENDEVKMIIAHQAKYPHQSRSDGNAVKSGLDDNPSRVWQGHDGEATFRYTNRDRSKEHTMTVNLKAPNLIWHPKRVSRYHKTWTATVNGVRDDDHKPDRLDIIIHSYRDKNLPNHYGASVSFNDRYHVNEKPYMVKLNDRLCFDSIIEYNHDYILAWDTLGFSDGGAIATSVAEEIPDINIVWGK